MTNDEAKLKKSANYREPDCCGNCRFFLKAYEMLGMESSCKNKDIFRIDTSIFGLCDFYERKE